MEDTYYTVKWQWFLVKSFCDRLPKKKHYVHNEIKRLR